MNDVNEKRPSDETPELRNAAKKRGRRPPSRDRRGRAPDWKTIFVYILAGIGFVAAIVSYAFAFLSPGNLPTTKLRLFLFVFVVMLFPMCVILANRLIVLRVESVLGQVAKFTIDAAGGVAFAIVLLVLAQAIFPLVGYYRISVYLNDDQGRPVSEARVRVTGAEAFVQKGDHLWEIKIPEGAKPASGELTVYAANPNDFLSGTKRVQLDESENQSVTIDLARDRSARARGRIVDARTGAGIPGVKVSVEGNEQQPAISGASGEFDVAANAGAGEGVVINAEKDGYLAEAVVGRTDERAVIRLAKQRGVP